MGSVEGSSDIQHTAGLLMCSNILRKAWKRLQALKKPFHRVANSCYLHLCFLGSLMTIIQCSLEWQKCSFATGCSIKNIAGLRTHEE